jgi:protein TonB
MSTSRDRLQFVTAPDWPGGAIYASANPSAGFVTRKRSPNPSALLFSVIITGAFFGALFLLSGAADEVRPADDALTVIALAQINEDERDPPKEKPVDQPEVIAESEDEASPSSRPRTIAPAPALPALVPAPINLPPVAVQVPVASEDQKVVGEATSKGDLAQGPVGAGGAGGDGVAGNGSGGAGSDEGEGSELFASWAPSMDFSLAHRYYPQKALRARIEGVVLLDCVVLRRDRVRDCRLVHEKPTGYGFGQAALQTERGMRLRAHNQAGKRVYDRRVNVVSYFVLAKPGGRKAAAESTAEDSQAQP